MVRLKDRIYTKKEIDTIISIPYGAIKSCLPNSIACSFEIFQFLMVRLKATNLTTKF